MFARVCTLHTLATLHIYIHMLEAQRSFARVCYIHCLPPSSPDLNKTALWPLSLAPPHRQLGKEASGSRCTGKGRRCSVHSTAFGEGGNPLSAALFLSPSACAGGPPTPSSLLSYVVWADPASLRMPCHILTTLRYKFL